LKRKRLKDDSRVRLGRRGESLAWDYLVKHGYKILDKNYRCSIGEIDVVAEKGKRVAIIEIRTRSTNRFGHPEESVNIHKQRRLTRLAQWYLKDKKKMNASVSFNVLAIILNGSEVQKINLIEDAFLAREGAGFYG